MLAAGLAQRLVLRPLLRQVQRSAARAQLEQLLYLRQQRSCWPCRLLPALCLQLRLMQELWQQACSCPSQPLLIAGPQLWLMLGVMRVLGLAGAAVGLDLQN